VPASWSAVRAREPEVGDWSDGDVGEPGADGDAGVGPEPEQPVASSAATARLARDRELFIKRFYSRRVMRQGNPNRLNPG